LHGGIKVKVSLLPIFVPTLLFINLILSLWKLITGNKDIMLIIILLISIVALIVYFIVLTSFNSMKKSIRTLSDFLQSVAEHGIQQATPKTLKNRDDDIGKIVYALEQIFQDSMKKEKSDHHYRYF